jgi:hypothetical protein
MNELLKSAEKALNGSEDDIQKLRMSLEFVIEYLKELDEDKRNEALSR